ncbi:MAG: TolA-binding protein [Cryomorphaceae bacterium]|jgi:TolA-binding protein
MMKVSNSFLLTCFLLVLLGCSFDPIYEAEKAYWEARKIDRTLHQDNPDGLEEENYEEIIAALKRVSDAAPFEPMAAQAQFQIAQIYLGLEKTEQAHEILKKTFFRFSKSENKNESSSKNIASQAAFWSGKLYEKKGEVEKAQEVYANLMDRYPLTTRGLQMPIYIVQYYKTRGNLPKMKEASARAHSHYKSLIDQYSGTTIEKTVQRYNLQVYALEEAWQDILNFWDSEINTQIERSGAIRAKIARADLLASRMENIPEAERIYKDLIDQYPVEPITPLLRIRLGYLLIAAAKTEEARETFAGILTDFSENIELNIQSNLGLAAADNKDREYEKVLARYDDIFAEFPNHASTLKIPLVKYLHHQRIGNADDEVEQALEEAFKEYSSRWDSGGSSSSDKIAGRLLLLCLIKKKDWDTAAIHLQSITRRFPQDPDFIKLMKTLYRQDSDDPAKALQILFDSSNDSPLFQPKDSPMQDIEETFDDTLQLK